MWPLSGTNVRSSTSQVTEAHRSCGFCSRILGALRVAVVRRTLCLGGRAAYSEACWPECRKAADDGEREDHDEAESGPACGWSDEVSAAFCRVAGGKCGRAGRDGDPGEEDHRAEHEAWAPRAPAD